MIEHFNISFYDKDDIEIGRKTYRNGYGRMIASAHKRAVKLKAKYFYHIQYLRKFEVEDV